MVAKADLTKAYDSSYYTILGAGGELSEWTSGLTGWFAEKNVGTVSEFYVTTGAAINAFAATKGVVNNPYADELTVLMFDPSGMDVGKLAIQKMLMGDRWFDDVVDNMIDFTADAEDDIEDEL
jgi:hypothetical protein